MESSASDDISETTHHRSIDYFQVLKRAVSPLGPNARPPKNTFGSTSKLDSLSAKERIVDYTSMTRDLDGWRIHNELGHTMPRKKLATTYGKLLENPGPADYTPDPAVLSTEETGPRFTLHSRTFADIVDKLEVPGPGSYEIPSCIETHVPLPGGRRKIKNLSSSNAVVTEKIGPGSYSPSPKTEFGKFKREVCALLAPRSEGTKPRAVLDKKTLHVRKRKAKVPRVVEETAHLGPGCYFQQPPTSFASSLSTDLTATAPPRWKRDVAFNIDPMSPTQPFHTLGWRRNPESKMKKELSTYPGPGHYEGADKALFGTVLLKEGGGAVTRPGKMCMSTSVSEGAIPGQHAAASNVIGISNPPPKMISQFSVPSDGNSRLVKGTWHKAPPHGHSYSSPYAVNSKKDAHVIYHNAGRITESTVTEHPNAYRGKGSVGAFMRFPAARTSSK